MKLYTFFGVGSKKFFQNLDFEISKLFYDEILQNVSANRSKVV